MRTKGWHIKTIKLASKRAPQLVHEVLGFTGVCLAHDQSVKRNVVWVHLYLILARLELSVHNVHLRIADCEDVTWHFRFSEPEIISVELKEHTVFGVHKTDVTALQFGVRQGTKVD